MSELEKYFTSKAISKSKENRKFIEQQLAIAKKDLSYSEEQLKKFSEQYKILSPQEQITIVNQTLAGLKSELFKKEIELKLLPRGGQRRLLQDHISVIRKEIAKLEYGSSLHSSLSRISLSEFPALILEHTHLTGELSVRKEVYTLLRKQLETAKIAEAKESSQFQLLDTAIPAKSPIKSKKKIIVGLAGILGLFGGIFLAFLLEGIKNEKKRFKEREEKRRNNEQIPHITTS